MSVLIYHGNISCNKFRLPLNVAVIDSYHDFRKKPPRPDWCTKYFMDSGAFSISRRGGVLDVPAYCEHLKKYMELIDIYAAMDVIGNPSASWDKFLEMKATGLNPLPCFHAGEPFQWLQRYVDAGETYIGLGGAAALPPMAKRDWIRSVFERFPDPKVVGFHGFGVMDVQSIAEFPWKSIDARTASLLGRFGGILTPWGTFAVNPELKMDRTDWRTDLSVKTVREWVESLGADWALAQQRTGGFERMWITITYLESLAETGPEFYNPRTRRFAL